MTLIDADTAASATGRPPAVTAVVPTHHRPELMRRAVQSIIDQDFAGPIEIIVVFDDCELRLPDVDVPGHRVLRGVANRRTRGLAGARNSGILAAQHDFIAFLDDDDAWLPGKLAAQMAVFDEYPEVGLVGTAMQVDDGRTTHDRLAPQSVITHQDLLRDRVAGLHSSSFVFRRGVLIDGVGMVDEQLPGAYGEDYDVLLTASRISPVRVVNRPLVSVRWSGDSYFYGRWAQYAAGLTYLLDKHPDLRSDPDATARIESQIGFALAAAGRRVEARPWLWRALRCQRANLRAWLGLLVSVRLLSAPLVARIANLVGKGI